MNLILRLSLLCSDRELSETWLIDPAPHPIYFLKIAIIIQILRYNYQISKQFQTTIKSTILKNTFHFL